jgi:hypothetical protein
VVGAEVPDVESRSARCGLEMLKAGVLIIVAPDNLALDRFIFLSPSRIHNPEHVQDFPPFSALLQDG